MGGMPGLSGLTHNGISSGSSKSSSASMMGSGGGGGGTTIKAKPGTVAAALEEKKKAAAAAAAAAVAAEANNKNHEEAVTAAAQPVVSKDQTITNEPNNTNGTARENSNTNIDHPEKTSTADEGTDNEGSTKGGLTSEERVLLREKKKARLQKEQHQDGLEVQDGLHHEGHQDGHHHEGHHDQEDHHHQDGLHEDHDGGHSSDGGEGSMTENADGSKSDGPRLTRSG